MSTESVEQSIYVIGEIQEPSVSKKSTTKYIYVVFTLVSLILFGIGIISYLYSATIMMFYDLRSQYWNFGFVSLGISLVLFFLSAFSRNKLGYTILENNYQQYEIKPVLGKTIVLEKPQIYAISILYEDKIWGLITNVPYALISMYDRNFKIPLYRYKNQRELITYFESLSERLADDFYSFVQKSEVTSPPLFSRIWKETGGKLGIIIIFIYVFLAIWGAFSMLLYPSNTLYSNSFFLKNPEISNSFYEGYDSRSIVYVPPNDEFLLGTDWFGRDIFARLVYGTVHSFAVAILSASILMTLVLIFGYTSAFSRGKWDTFISRLADTLITFPPIIPIIIVATFVGGMNFNFEEQYFYYVFIILSLFIWPQGMKLLRSETKNLLKEEYVAASRQLGANDQHIILKHVLPKTSPTLVLLFVYNITEVMIAMTMLGLIGLGGPSSLTWGSDLERAINFDDIPFQERWWTLIYPSIWVGILIIGLTLLSDAIRDQFQFGR